MRKLVLILLGTSLVLNIALLYIFVDGSHSERRELGGTKASKINAANPSSVASEKIDSALWTTLKTDDLKTLVTRLREAGFPSDVIRAIIGVQLGEIYGARRKVLDPEVESRPFWKDRKRDPKVDAALRQLSRDHEKILRDLMGEDTDSKNPMYAAYMNRRTDGVSPEKKEDVARLLRDYDDKRADLYSGGPPSPADRQKIAALEKEQQEALAKMLSPAELMEYELRTSNTADILRSELSAFNPTEDEFRRLYEVRRSFDLEYNQNTWGAAPPSQEQVRQRADAQKQLDEQIKTALGPSRAADYERATDYNYKQADLLVSRLDLPPETTNQLWGVQKDIQQRSKEINQDSSLAPEDRTQKLAALAEEAKTKITATLGQNGFEAYKQYGGQWLKQLQGRPQGGGSFDMIISGSLRE